MSQECPLCHSLHLSEWTGSPVRFRSCLQCGLHFKDPSHHLSAKAEKQRYTLHQNHPESAGYVEFLTPVVEVVQGLGLASGARGLDYGCGPGPVLAQLLSDAGFSMGLYDPYFYADFKGEPCSFDFLVCTEAAEHFHSPRKEVERMAELLRPGAPIVWLTSVWKQEGDISQWYYTKDPTHVVFYTEKTLKWLAEFWGREFHVRGNNLIWWT